MKKIFCLLILPFFIMNLNIVKASTINSSVDFKIDDEFYLEIEKRMQDGNTYFVVLNTLGTDEMTEVQLRELLNRKTVSNQSPLTIYSKLNINVTPVENTLFSSLINKEHYYLGVSSEKFMYDEVDTAIEPSLEKKKVKLNSSVDIYSGGIIYKSPTNDEWTTEIPSETNLEGLTLEEQLATLLKLDLSINENAVIEAYQTLFNIYGISDGTNSVRRFDFYDELNILKNEQDSLKHIDSRYVIINYKTNSQSVFNETSMNQETKSESIIGFVIIGGIIIISIIGTTIYIRRYN